MTAQKLFVNKEIVVYSFHAIDFNVYCSCLDKYINFEWKFFNPRTEKKEYTTISLFTKSFCAVTSKLKKGIDYLSDWRKKISPTLLVIFLNFFKRDCTLFCDRTHMLHSATKISFFIDYFSPIYFGGMLIETYARCSNEWTFFENINLNVFPNLVFLA